MMRLRYTGILRDVSIRLPASKSESNRALILHYASEKKIKIKNLSEAQDTVTLNQLLQALSDSDQLQTLDVGPAGTTMRFLTAFLSIRKGNYLLTGSDRMKQRPIGILVESLKRLGADIEYTQNAGFPPLLIKGKQLVGGKIEMDASVSSQFISALLLVAPLLKSGIEIRFDTKPVSLSYLKMTISLLNEAGVNAEERENSIFVPSSSFVEKELRIEADWSSASYWYALAALSESQSFFLEGLRENSLQGDRILPELFSRLGVITDFEKGGVRIAKRNSIVLPSFFEFNFENCPDIAQTVACVCAGLKIPATLTGLSTLRIKETDRLTALQNELSKFGVLTEIVGNDVFRIVSFSSPPDPGIIVSTYHDHRMAMAFAPLVLKYKTLQIENPEVVGKSYPSFWKNLEQSGILIG